MSKKCLATLILYALFLTFMVGTALIFYRVQFDNLIGKIVVIVVLLLVSVALSLTVELGSPVTIAANAILWGTALSFMYDHLGSPSPLNVFYVALVMFAWFALFCVLTNFSFVKRNCGFVMLFWGVAFVVADVVFAVHMRDVLGWTALILLAPFAAFFAALPGEADGFAEHTHHIAIYTTLPALLIFILLLFLRVPVGKAFDKHDFFPEIDEFYVFNYCPKYDDDDDDDDDDDAMEDLSEFT